jgi:hypothetical protein
MFLANSPYPVNRRFTLVSGAIGDGQHEGPTMTHPQHEDFPWTIAVVDHAPRRDSPEYVASRALMKKIIAEVAAWVWAPGPYEDHHGGSVWVKDADGWLFMQLPLGIEWSAQFCADPKKVDKLRLMAKRIVRGFPDTIAAYEAFGYHAAATLLATEITTAKQVSYWTDSIFNASMPVPRPVHSGTFPHGAGYHHYPKPIVDIDHFRRDDFQLFVSDNGFPAVVVPMSSRPDDHRVRLIAAHPSAPHARLLLEGAQKHRGGPITAAAPDADALPPGQPTFSREEPETSAVLPADDDLALQAFRAAR